MGSEGGACTLQDAIETLAARLEQRSLEERLLAASSRLHLDQPAQDRLASLLAAQPDWATFVAMAEAHAVAPLVHRTLSQPSLAALIPEGALSTLRELQVTNVVANLQWLHELGRLVAGLGDAGITPLLLKGAALLHTVYPDAALRRLRDLDLLVRRRELPGAEQCLLDLGYRPAEAEWPVGNWPPHWYEKKYLRPRPGRHGIVVEIHWGLAPGRSPLRLAIDDWIEASEPVEIDGAQARVFNPVHQILHLCTHMAYNDGFGVGLSRPVDLHEVIEKWGRHLDWDRLAAEARRSRAFLCLQYSLVLAAALFDTTLPLAWREQPLNPLFRLSLAVAALERVLVNDRDPAPLPSTLAKLVSTDRLDLRAALRLLLPRPRHLRHSYRLLQPMRLWRALRYARSVQ